MTKASTIETALRSGAKLHAFMSGGGLRVTRLERDGHLVGYGEAPEIEESLRHVVEDFEAGGRPYREVYGKIHEHYLTGQSKPSSPLDAWIRQGQTFDAWADGDTIVVALRGYVHHEAPPGFDARVMAGETLEWESRGYTYESSPSRFPNGEPCRSTRVVSGPDKGGADPWMWEATRTGSAATFVDAVAQALTAQDKEAA